jgi:thiol:disulfide interchange protein DsbD
MFRWLLALGLVVLLPEVAFAADDGGFAAQLSEGWVWLFLGAFGAGVTASLTPCVYPMIPIVMSIFGARGEKVSRGRAVALATAYVLGMGVMYSALGVAAGLAGVGFGTFLANPWVVWPMVAFYLLLAASMFGAFELNLPASWQARLAKVGGHGYGGAFGMGLVGGLTAAPCTGPWLLGLLGFVAQSRSVSLGFGLMFVFALGMGLLYWVLAISATALPKSGRWMEAVKSIGGIALLVMGVYFLRPVLPVLDTLVADTPVYAIVSGVLMLVGIFVGGVHLSFHGPAREKARKTAGVALSFVGAAIGMLWLQSADLTGWRVRCADAKDDEQKATCFVDDQALIAEAHAAGQPVLVDFGASWCKPCKLYETEVFADPLVAQEIAAGFLAVKFDVSKNTDENQALKARYDAGSLPTVILYGPDGREVRRFHEPIPTPEEFAAALREARQGAGAKTASK